MGARPDTASVRVDSHRERPLVVKRLTSEAQNGGKISVPSRGPNSLWCSHERRPFRREHDHRTGDLVVPRLTFLVEEHPDETETRDDQRKETAERAHDGRRPVD